ncbi:MAG: mechanosensitive ion channel [Bacteroidetes bacterium]|nr:mechanosensitive ion channel [Bacteroidota bacterium]MCH8524020.1 mechanosensitive ion channel family protein [Balneolales bacterium]
MKLQSTLNAFLFLVVVFLWLPIPVAGQSDTTIAVTDTVFVDLAPSEIDADTQVDTLNQPPDSVTVAINTARETAEPQVEATNEAERIIPSVTEIISFGKIFMSILVLLLVWVGSRFISSVLTNLSERFSGQRLFIKRLVPIVKVLVWSVALYFIIAGILQPPLETIITVSASIGIAVGFASQDILRNIFGGIMIILDRPFQVGDKIEVDKQYGEVLQIGLRSVRIVTEDDSVVTVPNAEIMNKSVSNANSSALDCQVVAELFLPRTIDTRLVEKVCRKAAMTSRFAYLNKPVYVHVTHVTVGPKDYLKVRLKAYVLDIRFEQELRSDMTTICMDEFNRLGLLPTA